MGSDMTRYLIFDTLAVADARSCAVWTPGPGDTITVRLWDIRPHPTDGRAALVIPAGSEGALTVSELADLVDVLPADWTEETEA